LAPVLATLPVEVVIDHMAWRGWKVEEGIDQPGFRALRDLIGTGRAWVKLGGIYRYSRQDEPWSDLMPYSRTLIEDRSDRILWCTDWPHVRCWDHTMPNDASLLEWLADVAGDDATTSKILVENPAKLYDF
jgi:predicted TIM-barrel fold metal-dependent hydrolase